MYQCIVQYDNPDSHSQNPDWRTGLLPAARTGAFLKSEDLAPHRILMLM
jgi:hypothetical protein